MLTHRLSAPTRPQRVVILGANGFVAGELRRTLEHGQVPCLALGSNDVDLTNAAAPGQLANFVRTDDAVVFASALTPDKGRDNATLMKNLRMGENVCAFLTKAACAHMIYISSDGVYDSGSSLINEESACETSDLYAISHTVREKMLLYACQKAGTPFAIVRPCAIYGAGDTHNGYGPNRFIRTALNEGKISLFGGGEERRDHIYVEDVAKIVLYCLLQGSAGVVNAVTGQSRSFLEVAEAICSLVNRQIVIERLPRNTPVTHRHFDITALVRAFPEFRPTCFTAGVADTVEGMSAKLKN